VADLPADLQRADRTPFNHLDIPTDLVLLVVL
jgi:hypothetical protein